MPSRIAVFASGSGSNLQAILEHFDSARAAHAGRVVLVVSDRATAPALARSASRAIPAVALRDHSDADDIDALLSAHDVNLLALAGYLKLVLPTLRVREEVLQAG